jgi:SAM-dependent methyltransferase
MKQGSDTNPPWNSVDEMVRAYQRRLTAGLATHELFYYRDAVQYNRKLAMYGSILRSLNTSVGSLLDVGCGTGSLLQFYTPVDDYLGVDVSPELVAVARRMHPSCEFLSVDIHDVELPVHETVTLIGALGTSPRPIELLRRTSGLALTHLVFDYLPSTGSAAGLQWLHTLLPQAVNDVLTRDGWTVTRDVSIGSSAVVLMCKRE